MMALRNASSWIGLLQILTLLLTLNPRVSEAVNSEGNLLQAFKLGLEDPRGALSDWNDLDITPCKWYGISCNNVTSAVIVINLAYLNLTGALGSQLAGLQYLESLYLSNNSIGGSIPEAIGTLDNLRILNLADNMLEGSIPESFSNLTSLYYLDLSNNQLSGEVPQGALLRFNRTSYLGNTKLCGLASVGLPSCSPSAAPAPSSGPSPSPVGSKSGLSLVQIVLLSVGLFLGFKFLIAVILIMRWMRKDNDIEINLGAGGKIVMFQAGVNVPTSKEMLRALRLIRKQHIIGEGGFGVVYKLQVNDHPTLAVKKLRTCLESERSFENELDTLGTVKHRNLVKLKGFCSAPNVKLLIYDFLPGGNLDQLLHGEKLGSNVVVDWPIRYRVALGVARGLAYLHHGCNPRIIHGDVSSTNILLDTEFQPYLSDFGLAKLVSPNDTHVSVTVGGTFGYVAPEFAKSGKATEKVDVYSYGVILLELLSGRRAVDESMPDDYTNLAAWVRDLHSQGRAIEIVDEVLRDSVSGVELDLLLEVACHCISLNSQDRPHMNKVVEMLEILTETEMSPSGTSVRTSHEVYSDGSLRDQFKYSSAKLSSL